MYKQLIRPVLFKFDPETAHNIFLKISGLLNLLTPKLKFNNPALERHCFGLKFKNPIGLAAGFDKNCEALHFLSKLGFSHIELGTVVSEAQSGNERPRIFRLAQDAALINRMGFPSVGVEVFRKRLAAINLKSLDVVVGINIGKARSADLDHARDDYLKTFLRLRDLGNYFSINVSSPNTPELRKLQERSRLNDLLKALNDNNSFNKPLLLKVAPDLNMQELEQVVECALENSISAIIATNTTIARDGLSIPSEQAGGLSGRPLREKSLKIIKYIKHLVGDKITLIGVGGISRPSDAIDAIEAGADLLQIYTGFIYEGPGLIPLLLQGLTNHRTKTQTDKISQNRHLLRHLSQC